MQSISDNEKFIPIRGLKQVKVDNWGTFFLQRLLQLYFNEELLDLNIKFDSCNNALKVHRLVVTTCTDYFLKLEREQNKNNLNNNVIVMPSDMPYECVKSIISFMYTGQLEYWSSEQNALYYTAQKMNMSVLTKLLDAQLNANISDNYPLRKDAIIKSEQIIPNIKTSTSSSTHIIPGKKLPIWKRKLENEYPMIVTRHNVQQHNSDNNQKFSVENNGGPSRFDLPEMEDLTLGVFSSFDDITYNTKPIAQAPEKIITDNKINTRIPNSNLPDMFLTLNNEKNYVKLRNQNNDYFDDWSRSDFDSNFEHIQTSPIKKVRFNLDEKENSKKSDDDFISSNSASTDSVDNHAKIIREVLKKYPHLVQHNKNIRLKIMQRESKNSECSIPGKTKVSYLILKSDSLITKNSDKIDSSKHIRDFSSEINENGPWKCEKCNLEKQYLSYFMYRRHMQDVHGDKFDPRICEHCGYKATKRNILMYHMYTKHNVSNLKNTSFPKCHMCSYIALSESLLLKHQLSHKHRPSMLRFQKLSSESIKCAQCEKNFTDVTELALHEMTSGHGTSFHNKEKKYHCIYCDKHFVKINNLKIHIDYQHKNMQKFECFSEVPVLTEPSSEAESLNNIASSIATSLSVGNELQSNDENDKQYAKSQINTTYNNNLQFQDDRMIMLINEENNDDEVQYQPNISIDDEIVVRNSDGDLLVYIQNTENVDPKLKLSVNDNYRYAQNNEIIEEVVEEFEAIDDLKEKQELEYKKLNNIHIVNKEEKELCRIQHILNYENINTHSTAIDEVIQYVEEETEILEYETCTDT